MPTVPKRRRTRASHQNSGPPPTVVVEDKSSWEPLDVAAIVKGIQAGEITGPVPTMLERSDGQFLFYAGEVHSISGEPETGKGWICLEAVAEALEQKDLVLYLDFEDRAESIIERLLARGVSASTISKWFKYVRPSDPLGAEDLGNLLKLGPFVLVVIDGLTEAYHLLGLDPMSNKDAPKFLAELPRPFARTGAAVVQVDHVTKDWETRGRWAIGAQHKIAGIAVAYKTETLVAFSRQKAGKIKLKLTKDKHGHVGVRGTIAIVSVEPMNNGTTVLVTINPPDSKDKETGDFRPTWLMAKGSKILQLDGGLSKTALRKRIGGKSEYAYIAIAKLEEEGYIENTIPGKQRKSYTSIKPFVEDEDED